MLTSFRFSPGGLDTLIRDLTVEDKEFISQRLNVEDPEGKLDQLTNSSAFFFLPQYYTLLLKLVIADTTAAPALYIVGE